jgi:hypothetical protein
MNSFDMLSEKAQEDNDKKKKERKTMPRKRERNLHGSGSELGTSWLPCSFVPEIIHNP